VLHCELSGQKVAEAFTRGVFDEEQQLPCVIWILDRHATCSAVSRYTRLKLIRRIAIHCTLYIHRIDVEVLVDMKIKLGLRDGKVGSQRPRDPTLSEIAGFFSVIRASPIFCLLSSTSSFY
jgi:hypothetical protein